VVGPSGVAEFAEDLPEPVVHRLEDGRTVGQVRVFQAGESGDGLVDAGVSGRVDARVPDGDERFWMHCFGLLRLQLTSAGLPMR
jgi:hypothetical protein